MLLLAVSQRCTGIMLQFNRLLSGLYLRLTLACCFTSEKLILCDSLA
jgi:hypothetical protein